MEGWLPASYFFERGVMCNFDVGDDDGDGGGALLLLFHVQLLPQGRAQRPDWRDQVEGRDENRVST